MKRRLLNFVTALSLLLCVAATALWLRSYRAEEVVAYRFGSETGRWRLVSLKTAGGRFVFEYTKPVPYPGGVGWGAPWAGPEVLPRKGSVRSRPLAPGAYQTMFFLYRLSAKWQGLGFVWCSETVEPNKAGWVRHTGTLIVPPAPPIVLLAALPVYRLNRRLVDRWHARRRRRGHCAACGYDLTGNVSGVCPECGGTVAVRG